MVVRGYLLQEVTLELKHKRGGTKHKSQRGKSLLRSRNSTCKGQNRKEPRCTAGKGRPVGLEQGKSSENGSRQGPVKKGLTGCGGRQPSYLMQEAFHQGSETIQLAFSKEHSGCGREKCQKGGKQEGTGAHRTVRKLEGGPQWGPVQGREASPSSPRRTTTHH